jgi:hypothetical protein
MKLFLIKRLINGEKAKKKTKNGGKVEIAHFLGNNGFIL